jgi:hypothetical protein
LIIIVIAIVSFYRSSWYASSPTAKTKPFLLLRQRWADIESCFDIGDEQEETDAETKPTDVNTDVDRDDEADLPDLEWLAHSDNAHTVPVDIDTDIDGDDEADLAWIAGEENAYPLEYYLNQENNSDKSEDKDEDYSDGSLLLDIIKGSFHWWVPHSLLTCRLLLLDC